MNYFANRLYFSLLTILVVLLALSSADIQSEGRVARREQGEVRRPSTVRLRRRRRPHKTPEDAIRRQIERVKEKILSQLSYSVRTAPAREGVRMPLPQPLLHDMTDIGMTGHRAELAIVGDVLHRAQSTHDTEVASNYKQARLIVFSHKSEYSIVRY